MSKKLLLASAAVILSAGAATPAALAADEDDTILVVGETTNIDISAEEIERLQANDVADIFRETPSVSVGGSLGIAQKVYIRGLEDTLLNVTVDGAPQTGTLFHHIGRVSIEPELLRQVQVQTGAGEATAGFGAIGGAIRFQTQDAADLLDDGERFGVLAKASAFSNAGYKASVSAYGQLSENWGLLGSYVLVDRDNMEDGDGNTLYGTAAEQALGFVKLSGSFGQYQRLSLSYEQRNEEGEFGQRPNWPALENDIRYPAEGERRTLVGNYGYAPGGLIDFEATAYHTTSEFQQNVYDRWGIYTGEIETWGFDLRNTSRLGEHEIVYGVEHRDDTVISYYADDTDLSYWAWDPAIGRFTEEGSVWGVYAQDHWQVTDPLLLSFGMRYDSYELEQVTYDDGTESEGFSGNAGLVYSLTPDLAFSAGYAQAMRGKEVGDSFTLEKRPGRIMLDPDLDAEGVDNAELGLVYDNGSLRAGASVYRMEIDDVIMDQLGGGAPPQDAIYYENIGTLEADGIELRIGYGWEKLQADLFFTTYDSELNGNTVEGYEQIGLANASGDAWNLNVDWFPRPDLVFTWNMKHVQDLNDIETLHRAVEIGWIDDVQTVDKPGYTVNDIYMQWRPVEYDGLSVGFAVQNLFDVAYRDHASVADYNHIPGWEGVAGVMEAGRDIRLTIGYDF